MSLQCAACKNTKPDDWVICTNCQRKTTEVLRKIPTLHRMLSDSATLKLPEQSQQERRSKETPYGAPANLHAIMLVDKRTDVRATLTPWLDEIYEAMGLDTPFPHSVEAMCARMVELAPWWAANLQACPDMIQELRHQHGLLDRVVNGGRRPPSPVPCPVILPTTGQCLGSLHLHPDGSVTCPACSSEWAYENWRRLGALLAP